ncbi:unnamed protein product, partial [Adineta steineri]
SLLPTLDYIDIASELTRFVHRKPLEILVHSISDKLSLPLETLKRRGISVDRLLKNKQRNRSYSQNEFQHSEYSRRENNNLCEYIPSSNMIRYQTLLHNIPLYIDENVIVTDPMIEQGKQLAYLLSLLAHEVFHMSQSVVHLFRDINSARIAFNNKGALFFNLRYFEQVFVNDPEFNLENDSIVRTLINFYFLIFCHELSHNIHLSHDIDFIHCFERVIVKFMNEKELFVSKFSFTSKVN